MGFICRCKICEPAFDPPIAQSAVQLLGGSLRDRPSPKETRSSPEDESAPPPVRQTAEQPLNEQHITHTTPVACLPTDSSSPAFHPTQHANFWDSSNASSHADEEAVPKSAIAVQDACLARHSCDREFESTDDDLSIEVSPGRVVCRPGSGVEVFVSIGRLRFVRNAIVRDVAIQGTPEPPRRNKKRIEIVLSNVLSDARI